MDSIASILEKLYNNDLHFAESCEQIMDLLLDQTNKEIYIKIIEGDKYMEQQEKIEYLFKEIEKCASLYALGELTFDEAVDKAYSYFQELWYIRYKEVIDKFIDCDKITGGDM